MAQVPLAPPPPEYEQRWMFLLYKRVIAAILSFTSEAIGFTISGGTVSKTLTVPLDATVSGTNTGDNAGVTSITVTGANGIGVSGSPITSSGTIGLSLGALSITNVVNPLTTAAESWLGPSSSGGVYFKNGNIGIGTTSPLSQLHIGNSSAGGEPTYRGNVVIDSLQTNNASNGLEFKSSNSAGGYGYRLATVYDGAVSINFYIQTRQSSASWSDVFAISGAQKSIGIGTSAPSAKLHLAGTSGSAREYISLTSGNYANGTDPTVNSALEIFDGTASVSNTAFGFFPNYGSPERSAIVMGNQNRGGVLDFFSWRDFGAVDTYDLQLRTKASTNDFLERVRFTGNADISVTSFTNTSVCVGSTSSVTIGNSNGLQVAGTTAATNSLGISAWSADALGSRIELGKSRGAAIGTNTIVQNNDVVASVTGYGANGSTFTNLASISMEVDGTPGVTNDMPGRIVFSTTPNGSGTLTEAMRLSQDQTALFASSVQTAAPTTGTAAPWKLGTLVTGQIGLVVLSTQYLEVDVNGSLIKLATI